MYILAKNANNYSEMMSLFRIYYERDLNETLVVYIKEAIRLLNFTKEFDLQSTRHMAVLNAIIYTVVEQNGLIGKDRLITSRDLLQYLRTSKPTITKWSKWVLEMAPEIQNLKGDENVYQDEVSDTSWDEHEVENKSNYLDVLSLYLDTLKKNGSFEAFDQKVEKYLKTLELPIHRGLKEKKKTPNFDLWFDHDCRPYLLAKQQWAFSLYLRKEWERAYSLTSELLSLSLYDGVGCRYIHIPIAIYLGKYSEANELLSGYQDDSYAANMNKALLQAAKKSPTANKLIKAALKQNPYGVKILKVYDFQKDGMEIASAYAMGSIEEAEVYAYETSLIWREIPHAWAVLASVK